MAWSYVAMIAPKVWGIRRGGARLLIFGSSSSREERHRSLRRLWVPIQSPTNGSQRYCIGKIRKGLVIFVGSAEYSRKGRQLRHHNGVIFEGFHRISPSGAQDSQHHKRMNRVPKDTKYTNSSHTIFSHTIFENYTNCGKASAILEGLSVRPWWNVGRVAEVINASRKG